MRCGLNSLLIHRYKKNLKALYVVHLARTYRIIFDLANKITRWVRQHVACAGSKWITITNEHIKPKVCTQAALSFFTRWTPWICPAFPTVYTRASENLWPAAESIDIDFFRTKAVGTECGVSRETILAVISIRIDVGPSSQVGIGSTGAAGCSIYSEGCTMLGWAPSAERYVGFVALQGS